MLNLIHRMDSAKSDTFYGEISLGKVILFMESIMEIL